jgi:peptidoglycan lytic transglycosylase
LNVIRPDDIKRSIERRHPLTIRINKSISAAVFLAVATAGLTASACAESGMASVYAGASNTHGEGPASGMTAAHRSLPFGTKVRVTNRKNGNSVVVLINDRGPFHRGRVIDIAPAAAKSLGFSGVTPVTLAVVDR